MHDDITDVPGIRVGHDTNQDALTGCTVIRCDRHAVGGVDVRGGAPGTRETDLLAPTCTVNEVHAVLLTGGSTFGLDAATGVMRVLEREGIGFVTSIARIPIVPAAVIFDLAVGRADVRPDAASGERATVAATTGPVAQGSVGAGTGATVAKLGGLTTMRKGGIGSASATLPAGAVVGAIVVVNALGNIIDPAMAPSTVAATTMSASDPFDAMPLTNTTLAVVATNARLDKAQATKIAQMAHDGLARVINPVHTPFDGDVVFALAVAADEAQPATATDIVQIGMVAADVLSRAVLKAVRAAASGI